MAKRLAEQGSGADRLQLRLRLRFRRRLTADVLASTMPAWAAAQPTTSSAAAPVASQAAARGHMMDSRKGKNDAGIRGHGFVADNGVFTTCPRRRLVHRGLRHR